MDGLIAILIMWAISKAFSGNSKDNKNKGSNRKPIRSMDNPRENIDIKKAYGTFMKEIEREAQKETRQPKAQEEIRQSEPLQSLQSVDPKKAREKIVDRAPANEGITKGSLYRRNIIKDAIEDDDLTKVKKNNKLDLKRDLLKGLIYSEILAEPKSLRNGKRSI